MPKKYVLFLRGVNVNGVAIKMKELKEALNGMGYSDVQTILATGNVVLTLDDSEPFGELEAAEIAQVLGKQFQYDCHLFLRNEQELSKLLAAASTVEVPDDHHHYCLICDSGEVLSELNDMFQSVSKAPGEQFILLDKDAFWIVPKGSTLGSDFGSKVLGKKVYKSRLTSRNMNTINKVYAVCSSPLDHTL